MNTQNLFQEVLSIQESKEEVQAKDYYDYLNDINSENYNLQEQHRTFMADSKKVFTKYGIHKLKDRISHFDKNLETFKKQFEHGSFISRNFKNTNISHLYKIPETTKLPSWFEQYKTEELDKVRPPLNEFALRLYNNRINEKYIVQRNKLKEVIENKVKELENEYIDDYKIPVVKINELQYLIDELEQFDRVIPEITIQILRKAEDYARRIINNVVEFQERCKNLLN